MNRHALAFLTLTVACAPAAPTRWTEADALAPHRLRLDLNHDGRVTKDEYERTLWRGPDFASADLDGDGDLSAPELVHLVQVQSSTAFDGPPAAEPAPSGGPHSAPDADQEHVLEVLVLLGDALRSHGLPGPNPDAVAAAVTTGDLNSPETLAVLDTLRPAWLGQGWAWPAGLP